MGGSEQGEDLCHVTESSLKVATCDIPSAPRALGLSLVKSPPPVWDPERVRKHVHHRGEEELCGMI